MLTIKMPAVQQPDALESPACAYLAISNGCCGRVCNDQSSCAHSPMRRSVLAALRALTVPAA